MNPLVNNSCEVQYYKDRRVLAKYITITRLQTLCIQEISVIYALKYCDVTANQHNCMLIQWLTFYVKWTQSYCAQSPSIHYLLASPGVLYTVPFP